MSNNYEEEEDHSSTDDDHNDNEYDRALFLNNELAEDNEMLFYRSTNLRAPFSHPLNDGHEDPHFTIFNNKENADNEIDEDIDEDDLNMRVVKNQDIEGNDIEDPNGEAVSNHGPQDQNSQTQNLLAQSAKEESILDILRRRELQDRGREVRKKGDSRRRTLASRSPTTFGSYESLYQEGDEKETGPSERQKDAELGTQGGRENLVLGSNTRKEQGYQPVAHPGGAKTNKDSVKNKHSKSEKSDDLGITSTAIQRSEALREAGSTTRRYDDQQLTARVISKTKEQANQEGYRPNKNLTGSDTPSSASGGQMIDINTTKHPRQPVRLNDSPQHLPTLEELEHEVMTDYTKIIGKMITISKKKSNMVEDLEEGSGQRRNDIISEMAASKSLAYLQLLSKEETETMAISKMDLFAALSTTLKYRVDRAQQTQRDLTKDPLKDTGEAIDLVKTVLNVTHKLRVILTLFYESEVEDLVRQHEGVLHDLEEMEGGRGITGNWLPSDPVEIGYVFQWYWDHLSMLIEIDQQYQVLLDINKHLRHMDNYNILRGVSQKAKVIVEKKENLYEKLAKSRDKTFIKEEISSEPEELSQVQRALKKRQFNKRESSADETIVGYMTRSKVKDQNSTASSLSTRITYEEDEHVLDSIRPARKSTIRDQTERFESLSLNNLTIARNKVKNDHVSDIEDFTKLKDKSAKLKKNQEKKTRGQSQTIESDHSDHEDSYSVTCDGCNCTMFTHRASSGHKLICDCGHAWDHHTPIIKVKKSTAKDYGRFSALSSDDSDSDEDNEDLSSGQSGNHMKKPKTENWTKLYQFALQRGTEDFKISQSVIKIIFKSLRWGHHKINEGGGAEAKMVDAGPKVKAKIRPSKIGQSINVNEWVKLLNDETEDMCWPIWYRIQWICKTGGLANDIENSHRDLITTSLKIPSDKLYDYEGKPYDRTHARNDHWYWDCMWIELLLWIIFTFHFPTSDNNVADVIKQQLKSDLELVIDQDMASQDAYTREAQSVHFALQKAYRTAEESLSSLPSNPQYIYEYLIDVLKEKTSAHEAPQGEIIARVLEQARLKFARNPSEYITTRQPLSDDEIRNIRALGPSKLAERHFKMITQSLMERVRMGQPFYQMVNFGDIQNMQAFYAKRVEEDKSKKRSNPKADSNDKTDSKVNTSDDSEKTNKKTKANLAKVNNAKVEQSGDKGGVWDFYSNKNSDLQFEWEKGKPKCNTCGMAHSLLKGDCTWVAMDKGNPIIQSRAIAEYPNVFFTRKDGGTIVRHNIISELVNFGFPKLGINSVGTQQRVVSDLRYLAKQVTTSPVQTKKANNVKVDKNKNNSTEDEGFPRTNQANSKKTPKTMAAMDEEYAQSGDSDDSGGRG